MKEMVTLDDVESIRKIQFDKNPRSNTALDLHILVDSMFSRLAAVHRTQVGASATDSVTEK